MRENQEREIDTLRGDITNRLNLMSEVISQVISGYFGTPKEEQFRKIILNDSIIGYGGKVKVLSSLDLITNKNFADLMKLGSIRNGFAHATVDQKNKTDFLEYFSEKDFSVEKFLKGEGMEYEFTIDVMNSSGKIITKNCQEYYCEFEELERKCFIVIFDLFKKYSPFMNLKE